MPALRLKLGKNIMIDTDDTENPATTAGRDTIELPRDKEAVLIGLSGFKMDLTLSNSTSNHIISQADCAITNYVVGNFYIFDNGMKWIFVNYKRVNGVEILHSGDTVCFGYPTGALVGDDQGVGHYDWDLKYQVLYSTAAEVNRAIWVSTDRTSLVMKAEGTVSQQTENLKSSSSSQVSVISTWLCLLQHNWQ
ncbi:hypothetical protein Aperf_G00000054663 [Anoplocephala perfoliata]